MATGTITVIISDGNNTIKAELGSVWANAVGGSWIEKEEAVHILRAAEKELKKHVMRMDGLLDPEVSFSKCEP